MKFAKETITLLDQVNALYPGSVILRGNEEASGAITHDQVSTSMLGTRLMVVFFIFPVSVEANVFLNFPYVLCMA